MLFWTLVVVSDLFRPHFRDWICQHLQTEGWKQLQSQKHFGKNISINAHNVQNISQDY